MGTRYGDVRSVAYSGAVSHAFAMTSSPTEGMASVEAWTIELSVRELVCLLAAAARELRIDSEYAMLATVVWESEDDPGQLVRRGSMGGFTDSIGVPIPHFETVDSGCDPNAPDSELLATMRGVATDLLRQGGFRWLDVLPETV